MGIARASYRQNIQYRNDTIIRPICSQVTSTIITSILRRRITSYVATATRQISASTARFPNHPFVSMIVTNRSIHPNAHRWSKFRVDPTTETLEMRTSSDDNDDDDDGNSSTTIKI